VLPGRWVSNMIGTWSSQIFGQGGATSPYILDADYASNSYLFGSTTYGSEAAFLTAIGGSVSSGKTLIGPYVSPTSPELVPNGNVVDATGWAASQVSGGPATGAAVSGEYQVTAAVSASRPIGYSSFPVQGGKAYLASAKIRKDPAASTNAKFVASNDVTNVNGPVAGSALVGATSLTAVPARTFGPMVGVSTMFSGVLAQSGVATGMWAVDDLTVKEATPFAGWIAGGISGIVDFVTPAAAGAADKIIWQSDDGALDGTTAQQRNYARLCYSSDGHLRFKIFAQTVLGTTGTQQADIDLGVAAVSTTFTVQFVLTAGIAGVSVNGGAPITASPTNMPPLAVMRFKQGQVATTNDYDGTLNRVRLFRNLTPPAGMTLDIIPLNGDSYGSGFGVPLSQATGAAIQNVSVGGSTIEQEIVYRQNNPLVGTPANVFWDGSSNGAISAADYLSKVDTLIGISGGATRVIMMPPLKRASTSSTWVQDSDIAAGMASRLGANFIDAQAILALHGDGSGPDNTAIAMGYCPPSLLSDGVHLTAAGYNYVATAVAARWNIIK